MPAMFLRPQRCGLYVSIVTIVTLLCFSMYARAQVTVDGDFPGGNIIIDKIDGDTVTLHPDLRDTAGDWFYWCFRVKGAAGRTLTFKFSKSQPVGVRGPAVSTDGMKTWKWAGAAKPSEFVYTFPADAGDTFFGVGMTYTQTHFDTFLKQFDNNPSLRREVLCESKKGRKVERLHLGKLDGEPKYRIMLTARHHACEMMASYAMEGIISSLLADDQNGKWFRDNVEVLSIPFVDKDGVEDGDQGKNRKPRDHNRDYDGQSVHRETAALREFVPKWSAGKLILAMDLHCPALRGRDHEIIYQVGHSDPDRWKQQQKFGQTLEKVQTGALLYRQSDDFPFGKSWNKASNFTQGASVGRWTATIDGIKLVTTFELPYANAGGNEVNQQSAGDFGKSLASSIKQYLATLP